MKIKRKPARRIQRMTIEFPAELYWEMKMQSVRLHQSMRTFLIEALENRLQSLDKQLSD